MKKATRRNAINFNRHCCGNRSSRRQSRHASLALGVCATSLLLLSQAQAQNNWNRPFAPTSIWNTWLGSNPSYVAANLGPLGALANDRMWLYRTNSSDPFHYVYQPEGWQKPGINIPDSLIIPNEPNGCASFLLPDGVTLREYNALRRTTAGSDPIGYHYGDWSLTGNGIGGGQAGSGMSTLGGTIRKGELESSQDIPHALKIELDWAVLYRNSASANNMQETFRWPANRSDGNNGTSGTVPNYTGTNSALRMGSLLALPRSVNINTLGLSAKGLKLAKAFQNFGAYVVDSTGIGWKWGNGGYTASISVEQGASADYTKPDNGYYNNTTFYSDMDKIYQRLVVVNDNSATKIGGNHTANLASNSGFEANGAGTQTPSGWGEWSSVGTLNAGYSESYGGTWQGTYHGTHWSSSAYTIFTSQTKTGLANGLYTLRAMVKSSGGQNSCRLEAKDFGGSGVSAAIPASSDWIPVVINNINVTNGQCTFGIWSNANAGNWVHFDNVEFFKQ